MNTDRGVLTSILFGSEEKVNRLRGFVNRLLGNPEIKPDLGAQKANQHRPISPDLASMRLGGTPYTKGDFIGQHYEVLDLLGEGGFGVLKQRFA